MAGFATVKVRDCAQISFMGDSRAGQKLHVRGDDGRAHAGPVVGLGLLGVVGSERPGLYDEQG